MRADLATFLAATDLDETLTAADAIESIARADAEALHVLVTEWTDEQAMANLLMHPEMIPVGDRTQALVAGLSGEHGEYAVLAATVGFQAWLVEEEAEQAVAERLMTLATATDVARTTSMRATNALLEYADILEPDVIADGLSRDDPGIQHNLLVVLLTTWGPVASLEAIRAASERGAVSPEIVDAVEWHLAVHDIHDIDEPIDDGMAALQLLAPLPSLTEWTAAGGV